MITIAKAAILYEGKVYTGWRHFQIGQEMIRAGVCRAPFPSGKAQGFVTNEGRFVSRQEARRIAKKAGHGNFMRPTMLFSEDLWDMNGVSL